MPKKQRRRTVELPPSTHQPSKAELEEPIAMPKEGDEN